MTACFDFKDVGRSVKWYWLGPGIFVNIQSKIRGSVGELFEFHTEINK